MNNSWYKLGLLTPLILHLPHQNLVEMKASAELQVEGNTFLANHD